MGVMVEMGIVAEVKVEQGVPWFALELASSAYSTPRLVCLILRLVNSERSRCLSIMAWVLEVAEVELAVSSSS
jgi:hypothetical protein